MKSICEVFVVEHCNPLQEGGGGVILGIFAAEDSAKEFVNKWISDNNSNGGDWSKADWIQNRWIGSNGWEAVSIAIHSLK